MVCLFGNKLRELRKSKNISQEKLGEYLGVTSTAIYCWEMNKTEPPLETIKELAKYFDVSIDYLFGFDSKELNEIEKLKVALKEAGLMVDDDLTIEELEKALKIIEMLKENK